MYKIIHKLTVTNNNCCVSMYCMSENHEKCLQRAEMLLCAADQS